MEYWSDASEGANKRFFPAFETQYSSTPCERYEQVAIKNYDFNKLYNFRDI